MRGIPQNVAHFLLHAPAVAAGAALQPGLHALFEVADYELRHLFLPLLNDITFGDFAQDVSSGDFRATVLSRYSSLRIVGVSCAGPHSLPPTAGLERLPSTTGPPGASWLGRSLQVAGPSTNPARIGLCRDNQALADRLRPRQIDSATTAGLPAEEMFGRAGAAAWHRCHAR